jgi:ribose/xylose/arabinose/galactoside ABC-type transport system permease subunit
MGALFGVCYTDMCAFQAISRTAFVIPTPGIDLSVGSITGLSGVVAGYLIEQGLPLGHHVVCLPAIVIIGVAIVLGAGIDAVNGLLVSVVRIPAFIATLAMLYVARGAILLIAGDASFINLSGDPAKGNLGFDYVGSARWLNSPVMMYVMVIIGGIGAFIAQHTSSGSMSTLWAAMNARLLAPASGAYSSRRSFRPLIRPAPPIMSWARSRPWSSVALRCSAARAR